MSDGTPLDPAARLREIDDLQHEVQRRAAPRSEFLFVTWGLAWIVGCLAIYLGFAPENRPTFPLPTALIVAGLALVAAMAASGLHAARSAAGTRGPSQRVGAIVGFLYPISFLTVGFLGARLQAAGASTAALVSYGLTATCLVVGMLSAASALVFNELTNVLLGGVLLLAGLVSTLLPAPLNLFAGVGAGLGMLALAIAQRRLAFAQLIPRNDD